VRGENVPHIHLLIATGTSQRRLLDSTVSTLSKNGYGDVRRQETTDWRSLLTENMGGGLFDDRCVVIVEEAEKLGPLPDGLASLLSPPDSSCVIILVCKSETSSPIPKAHLKACSVSKEAELSPWSRKRDDIIAGEAKKYGASIRRDAVMLLKELYEDSGELAGEAAKLGAFCALEGRREITKSDVESLCLSDGSRGMLKLLDGICDGRHADSLQALDSLARHSELLPLLSALHNRARLALYIASFPGETPAFARALGAGDYALRQAESAARIYGRAPLVKFVAGLIRINSNEKSGMGASWRDLIVLVIDLMSSAGKK
jgi:DNA polymerase-3 subunit delta